MEEGLMDRVKAWGMGFDFKRYLRWTWVFDVDSGLFCEMGGWL
jgi:hypothetical protein